MADKVYRIGKNRLEHACMEGMSLTAGGELVLVTHDEEGNPLHAHTVFLKLIDSGTEDSEWGRLVCRQKHEQDTAVYIYALAVNDGDLYNTLDERRLEDVLADPACARETKIRFLKDRGAVRSINHEDTLLYSQQGRYLILAIDVIGEGEVTLSGIKLYAQGDNFMQTFPEIYRERDAFFHRFMSIYSSVYNDLQEEIDDLPKLLDVDTCPAGLLPLYASWLGIDLSGGFLPEQVCRDLVREGYELSKRKGTRYALARIIEIVLGGEATVLEHNTMRGYLLSDKAQIPANLKEGGVYDVTILVNKPISETLRHQLMFLLDQFKPVRAKLHLVQLDRNAVADGNSYLDMNAAIPRAAAPTLDSETSMSSALTLE